jgi:FdhD protein
MNDRAAEHPLPPPLRETAVRRLGIAASARDDSDTLAAEVPVALVFNGISHAVMMATPADLEDFALGFALSEGLIASRDECYGLEVVALAQGCEVQVEIASAAAARLKDRRRMLAGATGCGLCGIDSLAQLDLRPEPLTRPAWLAQLAPETVLRAFSQLAAHQPLNARTGAHHAAAWATPAGELLVAMEDVGRHNALDKLLGQRARERRDNAEGFVVMSSRASYELVRKCARLGVPALATISAPTTLAVDIAREAGLRLHGFCRGEQVVQYTP